MKVGFYGASRAGISMGLFFKESGVEISGYYSRDPSKSLTASKLTKSSHYFTVKNLVEGSDIVFLSVSDSALREVTNQLSKFELDNIIIGHLSGALPSDEVRLFCRGRLALHPIQSLIGRESDVEKLKNSVFSIEGDREGISAGEYLMEKTAGSFFVVKKEDKVRYHYAAALASNYMVSLLDYAHSVYKEIGLDDDMIHKIISSISGASFDNFLKDRDTALTGPLSRGDIDTVDKHFKALKTDDERDVFMGLLKMTLGYFERRQNIL